MIAGMPSLKMLSSMAHAAGKPSFESLTTEQRQNALIAALLVEQNEKRAEIAADLDAIRMRNQ